MTRISFDRVPHTRLRTLYAVIGVSPDATLDEIKAAYYALAARAHDRGQFAEGFSEATLAMSTLRDPERRRRYDAQVLLEGRQCAECWGAGRVFKLKRGRVSCPGCEGTGQEK